jgi:hypothetical protein
MSIRIDEINVENLGPINKLTLGFKDINLIYGKNERGKTFLVDFLLKSLFLSAPKSKRPIIANGLVKVSGLKEVVSTFSPSSRIKLETYLAGSQNLQLPNLYKLLVIRGGELALVEGDPSGINKQALKEYLSNQKLLDKIADPISATIKEAIFENGVISGKNAGEIRRSSEIQNDINTVNGLLESVNNNLSTGTHNQIEKELRNLQNEAIELHKAKCSLAFSISQEIAECEVGINKIPALELENLKILIRDYGIFVTSLEKSRLLIKEKAGQYENYQWLTEAIKSYQILEGGNFKQPHWILLGFSVFFFLVSILFAFLNFPIFVALSIILALMLGGVFIRNQYMYSRHIKESEEIGKISIDFSKRFNKDLANFATMQTTLNQIAPDYYDYQRLQGEITEKSKDIEMKEADIQSEFVSLTGKKVKPGEWQVKYQALKDRLDEVISRNQKLGNHLSRLNVGEEEYIRDPVSLKFDEKREGDLLVLIDQYKNDLLVEDQKLSNLRYEIQTVTRSSSDDWNELIHELELKRKRLLEELIQIKSKILGGNIVYQVIRDLRLQEDDVIRRNLDSENISTPMKMITHRYEKIEIDIDDKIIVSDPYNQFNLSELSTGAQEQMLLALRIGFASILLGKEKPFLILDDAFQHSDWTRREYLLETVMDLAKSGCQILYLSMDDHIRDLFQTKVKSKFGDKYVYYELEDQAAR